MIFIIISLTILNKRRRTMKKSITVFTLILCILALFVSCKKQKDSSKFVIGATPSPHAEMLELVKDEMSKQGYALEIKEFTDYVTPNEALESGEIDANFFQHLPYMNSFNRDRGFHLVNAGAIHIEPLALYSKQFGSLDAFKQSKSIKTIAIPNDPTNEGRALLLLESAGLITLNDPSALESTPKDIKDNPFGLKFREIEAATLPRILSDVDGAVINGNYAIPAGLLATRDGLYVEGADSPYVNIITVKSGRENEAVVKALVKALKSDNVKKYIQDTYPNGEVVLVN